MAHSISPTQLPYTQRATNHTHKPNATNTRRSSPTIHQTSHHHPTINLTHHTTYHKAKAHHHHTTIHHTRHISHLTSHITPHHDITTPPLHHNHWSHSTRAHAPPRAQGKGGQEVSSIIFLVEGNVKYIITGGWNRKVSVFSDNDGGAVCDFPTHTIHPFSQSTLIPPPTPHIPPPTPH